MRGFIFYPFFICKDSIGSLSSFRRLLLLRSVQSGMVLYSESSGWKSIMAIRNSVKLRWKNPWRVCGNSSLLNSSLPSSWRSGSPASSEPYHSIVPCKMPLCSGSLSSFQLWLRRSSGEVMRKNGCVQKSLFLAQLDSSDSLSAPIYSLVIGFNSKWHTQLHPTSSTMNQNLQRMIELSVKLSEKR